MFLSIKFLFWKFWGCG